ncbi:MAG: CPBP family intramembrane metalloprotease [Acidobacteriota bacterium]|nr:CPBP family intramembrane metalloprotease [Acidobacteriota bacterium]
MRAAAGFAGLLIALWLAARYFGATAQFEGHLASTVVSCAMLLLPYWAFGFGAAEWCGRYRSVFAPLLLLSAYVVFAGPRGMFRWDMFLGMGGVVLAVSALIEREQDWLALALLGISVDLHFFDKAWPLAGLSSMPKLLFVDTGLYGYLVLRPIGGIGYDFRARWPDFRIGLREFAFFTPIAIGLGFVLGFLHFHATWANPVWFGAVWVFTFFFIAVPEELFFRGLMLNLLERRVGARWALAVTSVLFGLAHFNKRAAYFNWRYVILAAIAGVFYGRAWLRTRRVTTSAVTHATVDAVWSIWLR